MKNLFNKLFNRNANKQNENSKKAVYVVQYRPLNERGDIDYERANMCYFYTESESKAHLYCINKNHKAGKKIWTYVSATVDKYGCIEF